MISLITSSFYPRVLTEQQVKIVDVDGSCTHVCLKDAGEQVLMPLYPPPPLMVGSK